MSMFDFLSQLMGGGMGAGGPQQAPDAGAPMQLPSAAPGGLGGLGGFLGGAGGNAMQALGQSLMTSPRNNPMAGFGKAMEGVNQSNAANGQRQMLIQILKQAGFSDEDAAKYASNPQMAQMAMQQMQRGMTPGG
jgi:hypothetical protein